ncbi:MAG: hypothetical protein DM484_05485 [Candidatus Methylumidiphilus alinenensis]|uniref:Uncharacterized protein n=1 Tax=Candidatus Methylumidiphilus alinenensis TaxID=2202197 RepID=A0A2W4RGI9_9GAMM|nr:MAG: hypothetical protein DM484_05485 [Candidatus Methylumidiphilus alinenensis]
MKKLNLQGVALIALYLYLAWKSGGYLVDKFGQVWGAIICVISSILLFIPTIAIFSILLETFYFLAEWFAGFFLPLGISVALIWQAWEYFTSQFGTVTSVLLTSFIGITSLIITFKIGSVIARKLSENRVST